MRHSSFGPLLGLALLAGCKTTEPARSTPKTPAGALAETSPSTIEAAVLLSSPRPHATRVSLSQPIVFEASLGASVRREDVEQGLRIERRGGGSSSGRFTWSKLPTQDRYRLTFTPDQALVPESIYVVSVRPVASFQPRTGVVPGDRRTGGGAFVTTFSTELGRPRVTGVQLVSKDGGRSYAYLRLQFSEAMAGSSLEGAVSVLGQQTSLDHVLGRPLPPAASEFTVFLREPASAAAPLVLRIDPRVHSASGPALDPRSFDAPTEVAGNFQVTLEPGRLARCPGSPHCWQWSP